MKYHKHPPHPELIPPLHAAAAHGDIAELERLLGAGADVNEHLDLQSHGYWHYCGLTPLMVAAASTTGATADTVRWLLAHGAALIARNKWGFTAARYAAGLNIPHSDGDGEIVVLHNRGDRLERLRALLDAGADPHEIDKSGGTLLGTACRYGGPEQVRLLIERGVRLEPLPGDRAPDALVATVWNGSTACLEILLSAGANLHAVHPNGGSLLHSVRDAKMTAVLLAAGVDPLRRDEYGDDAIKKILASSHFGEASKYEIEAARLMLQHVGGAKSWDPEGESLRYAVFSRNPEVVALLLECGADPVTAKWRERAGMTNSASNSLMHEIGADGWPIDGAEDLRIRETIELLVAASCPLEIPDAEGVTPLHAVIAWSPGAVSSAVELFLRHGVHCDPVDDNGVTPLMAAAESGEIECIRLLLAAGADPMRRSKDGRSAVDRARDALARERARIGQKATSQNAPGQPSEPAEPSPECRFLEQRTDDPNVELRPWIGNADDPGYYDNAELWRAEETLRSLERAAKSTPDAE